MISEQTLDGHAPIRNPDADYTSRVIPSYVERKSKELCEFVNEYFAYLPATSRNRLLNAIQKPKNYLFNDIYRELLNQDDGSYICLSDRVNVTLRNQGQVSTAFKESVTEINLQGRFTYFTNPLLLCELKDGKYCGPAASKRVVNRGQAVLTFEYDPSAEERAFLDEQIRWSIASTSGKSKLDHLYKALCGFHDFRRLEVVWSGNKSFHIHLLVDSRHLNPSRFSGEPILPPGSWPEVPDSAVLRAGMMACWYPVEEIVRTTLGITVGITLVRDETMREPERFRRLPWGVRIADEKNILGIPAGTRIPQIVIYSEGRSYARAGDQWMLDPATFFTEA